MQNLVRVLSQLNQEREQIMIDSLNKLVLFETSVDMTLKYDTKMFVKLIEEMQLKTTVPKSNNDTKSKEETKESSGDTQDSPSKTVIGIGF